MPLSKLLSKLGEGKTKLLRRWFLPGFAAILLLGLVFSDAGGMIEVEPGEVAIKYNNTSR